jgi:hypothetical protein
MVGTRPMRAWLLAITFLGGCDPHEFRCRSDRECIGGRGEKGLCALERCAFLDGQCVSRYRWDDTAGERARRCVDAALVPDAGPRDARTADAPGTEN